MHIWRVATAALSAYLASCHCSTKCISGELPQQSTKCISGELPQQSTKCICGELPQHSTKCISGELPQQSTKCICGELPQQSTKCISGEQTDKTYAKQNGIISYVMTVNTTSINCILLVQYVST